MFVLLNAMWSQTVLALADVIFRPMANPSYFKLDLRSGGGLCSTCDLERAVKLVESVI